VRLSVIIRPSGESRVVTTDSMRAIVFLLVFCGIMFPVCAQGQSPSSPRPRPDSEEGGVTIGGGQQSGGGNQGTGGGSGSGSGLGNRDSDRGGLGDRDTGGGIGDRDAGGGLGGDTGGAAQAGSQDAAPRPAGRAQRATGGSGGGGGARTISGSGGGGGTELRASSGSTLTVSAPSAFDPVMEREIEYKPLPEGGERLTLNGPMNLTDFLQAIHIATNWDVLVSPEALINLPFFLIVDKTPQEAMEILKFNDIYYEYDEADGFLKVMLVDEYLREEFGDLEEHQFQVQFADIAYIESIVTTLLSPEGRMITDNRTGRIYVWDKKDNLEEMRKKVEELDVQLLMEEFRVQYADLADIDAVFTPLLSPSGSILTDARTGHVVVWDMPERLEQMRQALTWLDVPLESRTFVLNYVDAENVVDSLEDTLTERGRIQVDPRYNTLTIADLPTRLDQMAATIESIDRELETRTWTVDYTDLEFVASQAEVFIPAEMGEIVLNEDVHQLTITGRPERLDRLDELIETWDVKRKQVHIAAYIVEVNDSVEREFNINWTYFDSRGQKPIVATGGSGFSSESTDPVRVGQLPWEVPQYGELESDNGTITRPILTNIEGETVIDKIAGNNLAFTLDYLDREDKATVLAKPTITVQDGEEAAFENATQVPYVSATTFYDTFQTGASTRNTNRVEFIDVGTILRVLPRVTEDENILLDVIAEDSTFTDKLIVANDQTSTVPQKTERRAETQLRVHSGDTVVLGGLRRNRAADRVTKTPFLGDLPGIGRLFRYPNKQSDNNTLLIFITTTIVDEYTSPESRELIAADVHVAERHRHNQKDFWGRLEDILAKGRNEISVSIGQSGDMYSAGDLVTLDELKDAFQKASERSGVAIVIRRHPRAPEEIVTSVATLAEEAGLKIVFDNEISPVVPAVKPLPDAPGTEVEISEGFEILGNEDDAAPAITE